VKITNVKSYTVHPGWRKNLIFVKVETDAGIHGWGEAYSQYDRDRPVVAQLEALGPYLTGRSPFDIKHFTQFAFDDYAARRGSVELFCAISGIEQALWDIVGRALCSEPVKLAFIRSLAPGLSKRFGENFAKVGMYPIPILTRDIPGYLITPHTDTRWKGITVQLYLPKDDANTDIGTIFHEKLPDGSLPKRTQMRFAPNSGYAFAVGTDTWHSADPVHNRVKTRDSILLTYFVDQGVLKVLRNRGKRVGNFFLNEIRHRI